MEEVEWLFVVGDVGFHNYDSGVTFDALKATPSS